MTLFLLFSDDVPSKSSNTGLSILGEGTDSSIITQQVNTKTMSPTLPPKTELISSHSATRPSLASSSESVSLSESYKESNKPVQSQKTDVNFGIHQRAASYSGTLESEDKSSDHESVKKQRFSSKMSDECAQSPQETNVNFTNPFESSCFTLNLDPIPTLESNEPKAG